MCKLFNFIKDLMSGLASRQSLDEKYLSESVDICDFERRLRELDGRSRGTTPGLAFALGLR